MKGREETEGGGMEKMGGGGRRQWRVGRGEGEGEKGREER